MVSYLQSSPVVADISGTFYFKEQLGRGKLPHQQAGCGHYIGKRQQFQGWLQLTVQYVICQFGGFNNATHEVSISYCWGSDLQRKLL
nr:hypothetical protein [uncultured Mucilaginibacter sp.]